MVISETDAFLNFPLFGIKIPSLDSRKTRTLEALKSHSEFMNRQSEWHIDGYENILSEQDIYLVHSRDYASGFFNERVNKLLIKAYELINSDGSYNRWVPEDAIRPLKDMVPRLLRSMSGAYNAGQIALKSGFCHCLGGGTHHGHRDFGHGFCPLNDSALAIRKLMKENRIQRAWVIDLDAHKGDGTAAIFANDPRIATLSIHMARGWPLDGSLPANHPSYIPSSIDIPIESGEEEYYLEKLDRALRKFKGTYTANFVIVLAGADPWEGDELPSTSLLNLTIDQVLERDKLVYNFLEKVGLPSAWLTAGGYGAGSWRIHTNFLTWVLEKRLGVSI